MLRGLFRSLAENAFLIFSFIAILSAFLYVVVYPSFASSGGPTAGDDLLFEGLVGSSTPALEASRIDSSSLTQSGKTDNSPAPATGAVATQPASIAPSMQVTASVSLATKTPTPSPLATPARAVR